MGMKFYTGDFGFVVRCEGRHIVRFINEKGKEFYPKSDGKNGYIVEEGVTDGAYFVIQYCDKGKKYNMLQPLYQWD